MMCRQVLPDTNGIEQIYIVKAEPGTDGENGPGPMAPEDVDQLKREPSSDGDDEPEPESFRREETDIKDEPMVGCEDGSKECDFRETDEEFYSDSGSNERISLKRKLKQSPKYAKKHSPRLKNKCYICKLEYSSKNKLEKHLDFHLNLLPYTCNKCETPHEVTSVRELNKHFETQMDLNAEGKQPQVAEGIACHCGMMYRKESLLDQHKEICDIPEDITESACRFCQKTFFRYAEMLDHVSQHHGLGMPETKCLFCTERFKNVTILVIHEMRHQLPNVIKCDQCNRIFRQQTNLERHLKVHSNEIEILHCDNCGKTFTSSTNLEIHKRVHSGTRPNLCDLCPKSFYCPSTLRHHRLTHFKTLERQSFQETSKQVTDEGDAFDIIKFTGKTEVPNEML